MPIDLSDQSIDALAEIISGGGANDSEPPIGLYRQMWKIEAWFRPFGVKVDTSQSRVAATKTAISLAMFLDSDDLVQRILEKSADPRDFITEPERHVTVVEYLNKRLAFDDLRLEISGRKVRLIQVSSDSQAVGDLTSAAINFDFDTVHRDLDRALRSANDDPDASVTAACSLIESVCRSILAELEVPLPSKQDISGLYRAVREPLGLSPEKEGLSAEIVADVRAVLSGLVTAVQSIGALRTHGGSAHGKTRGARRVDARIAKLAVHSASAVALFLIETWQLRFPDRKLPVERAG
jgi:hypothetical protein